MRPYEIADDVRATSVVSDKVAAIKTLRARIVAGTLCEASPAGGRCHALATRIASDLTLLCAFHHQDRVLRRAEERQQQRWASLRNRRSRPE